MVEKWLKIPKKIYFFRKILQKILDNGQKWLYNVGNINSRKVFFDAEKEVRKWRCCLVARTNIN